MKTLTVTYHHTTNYGAVLQAYALQQTIMSLGHENLILETSISKKKKRRFSLKELYLFIISKLRADEFSRLKQHFVDFHTNRLYLTKAFTSMEDLRNNCPDVDCLITGSDQVWKFSTNPKFLDSRLLDFGPQNAIRFSYAASMEELKYSDAQKQKLKVSLENYKGISVREESAKLFIESFTPYKIERLLDPVFLLPKEKWIEIEKTPRLSGSYILCYQVQSNRRMEEVAYRLRRETGLPIVSICNSPIRWMRSDFYFHDVSIEEFIGFYHNASYIVSASFHGVAMGLVFEKPVYAMIKAARANRIKEVMRLFGLDDFIISEGETRAFKSYKEDDYVRLREIKGLMLSKSLGFINKMLSNERDFTR